jgi:hypothetical protein
MSPLNHTRTCCTIHCGGKGRHGDRGGSPDCIQQMLVKWAQFIYGHVDCVLADCLFQYEADCSGPCRASVTPQILEHDLVASSGLFFFNLRGCHNIYIKPNHAPANLYVKSAEINTPVSLGLWHPQEATTVWLSPHYIGKLSPNVLPW